MGVDLAAILVGILGAIVTVATYFVKKKQDRKEDQDAVATVEAGEAEVGMDRVDRLDAERLRKQQEGQN